MTSTNVKAQVLERDSLALVALYESTNGPTWTNSTNWLTGPVDTWFGVTVTNNEVVTLVLVNNGMAGTLPNEIGNLSALIQLDLGQNGLSGSIPTAIGNLSALQILNLRLNTLTGEIPLEIGNLSNLTALNLELNFLEGSIPESFVNLTQLFNLYLGNNQLTGEIPAFIGNLQRLISIGLNRNSFTGEIPSTFSNLQNLVILNLQNNQLAGEIPSVLASLPNLQQVVLNNNRLSGNIPTFLGGLTNLITLILDDNQLTGPIPTELGNLPNLVILNMRGNNLTGEVPSNLVNHPTLNRLDLDNNQLVTLPPLGASSIINQMNISRNFFSFDDIQPYLSISAFTSSPQNEFFISDTRLAIQGEILTLSLPQNDSIDLVTAGNQYQWFSNGNPISGAINESYEINGFTSEDIGLYHCEITNASVPNLTLSTNPFFLTTDLTNLGEPGEIPSNFIWTGNYVGSFGELSNDSISITNLTGDRYLLSDITGGLLTSFGLGERAVILDLSEDGQLSLARSVSDLNGLNFSQNGVYDPATGTFDISWYDSISFNVPIDGQTSFLAIEVQQGLTAPDNVIGELVNDSQVMLTWQDNSNNETAFIIERFVEGAVFTFEEIGRVTANTTSFVDNIDQFGSRYYYRVTATDDTNFVHATNGVEIIPPNALPADSLTLISLYNATDGPNWTNNNNWLTGPINTWQGITLEDGRVTGIFLLDNNLTGEIPQDIGNLTQLISLNLGTNNLTGEIPFPIQQIPGLRVIDLSNNNLTFIGEVDPLRNYNVFNISRNLLSFDDLFDIRFIENVIIAPQQEFPVFKDVFLNMGQDSTFALIQNDTIDLINGNDFQWFHNGNLIEGETGNTFTINGVGLEDIGTYHCEISNADFSDLVLETVPFRVTTDLSDFGVAGEIPTNTIWRGVFSDTLNLLGDVTEAMADSITFVNLGEGRYLVTDISGGFYSLFGIEGEHVVALQLDESDSIRLEEGLAGFGEQVSFLSNGFYNQETKEINVPWRDRINVQDAETDFFLLTIQDQIAAPSNVTAVSDANGVAINWVDNSENETQFIIERLTSILEVSNFTPFRFEEVGRVVANTTSFVDVDVDLSLNARYFYRVIATDGTHITYSSNGSELSSASTINPADSTALAAFFDATNGEDWVDNTNWLQGPVPFWQGITVTGFPQGEVTSIFHGQNNLTGFLPAEIGNLASLTSLTISDNQVSGNIPTELSNLNQLGFLDLRNNQFEGTIPSSLGEMDSLRTLNLSFNNLTGEVPAELANIEVLGVVQMRDNQLSGAFPSSFATHTSLRFLDVMNNNLTEFPDLSDVATLNNLNVANNALDFGDIEPNIGIDNFTYAPQANVGDSAIIFAQSGQTLSFGFEQIGGLNNVYQWTLNGLDLPGETSFDINIQSLTVQDTGVYVLRITNSVATDLTLLSNPITVRQTESVPPTVINPLNNLTLAEDPPEPIFQGNLITVFNDEDDTQLTYTAISSLTEIIPIIRNDSLFIDAAQDFFGNATVTVRASDASAFVDESFEVVVTPVNDAPIINGLVEPLSVSEDVELRIALTDFNIADVDNNLPQDFSLTVLQGDNYTLSGNTILPAQNFNGNLAVSCRVNDGLVNSEEFEFLVEILPVNDAPIINGLVSTLSVDEDGQLNLDLTDFNVSDVDNNFPQDFSLTTLPGENYTLDGNLILPAENFNGNLIIESFVNDGTENSNTFEFEIVVMPVNDIPVISGLTRSLSVEEDMTLNLSLADFDVSDVDNNFPDNFTLTILEGENYTFNGSTISPNENFNGDLLVNSVVNDGQNNSATFEFTVEVLPVNDAPVISEQVISFTVIQGELLNISLDAISVTDVDSPSENLSLSILPGSNYELSSDNNGIIPSIEFEGELIVPITVSDGAMTSEVFELTVTVESNVVTSIDDLSGSNISIFPNPASDHVSIQIEGITGGSVNLSIYDLSGKTLLKKIIQNNSSTMDIDLDVSQLPNQIYTLMLIDSSGKVYSTRIVKIPIR